MTNQYECAHLGRAAERHGAVHPRSNGCAECLASGSAWVHLRLCMDCGHVGCCDSSPNKHATAHYHATSHPVIKSYEPGEEWAWCYVDERAAESMPSLAGESPHSHIDPPGA